MEQVRDGWKTPDRLASLMKKLREISALHASTWEMNTQKVIATDRVPVQARPSPVLMAMSTS